ncbi:MAG: ribonuclease P [Candidatus Aenigmarchaeota archaeon]|nr:ribonuclease P [Candidatus Aenigmarchaeota archaeon]
MPEKKRFHKRQTRKKPAWQLEIANERIDILFSQADVEFNNNRPDLSNRYVEIARKIGMKYNTPLTKHKRLFCKKCGHYLKPGANARIRLDSEKKTIRMTCLDCGNLTRFGYSKRNQT